MGTNAAKLVQIAAERPVICRPHATIGQTLQLADPSTREAEGLYFHRARMIFSPVRRY